MAEIVECPYPVKWVDVSELKCAEYNPPERTAEGAKLQDLLKSVEEAARLYVPILVTEDNVIVDGHRRFTVCKKLGWERVPVLVQSNDVSRERAYADINGLGIKQTGLSNLHVYLTNPEALTRTIKKRHEEAEELIGRALLEELYENKMSTQVYNHAKRFAKYVDRPGTKSLIIACVKWILKHKANDLRTAMKNEVDPEVLYKTIRSGRPLKLIVSHAEEEEEENEEPAREPVLNEAK